MKYEHLRTTTHTFDVDRWDRSTNQDAAIVSAPFTGTLGDVLDLMDSENKRLMYAGVQWNRKVWRFEGDHGQFDSVSYQWPAQEATR